MSAATPQYDVVIIGAGVSGNTIALQLGLAGKKVLILEAGVAVPDSREEYMENFYLALAKTPDSTWRWRRRRRRHIRRLLKGNRSMAR
jgi:choline dehydrogenase-like flavoprotein